MQKIMVRPETAEDLRAIDVVNLSAFEGDAEAQLVSALRATPGFVPELSLVAEFNGRIVGHVLLTKVRYLCPSQELSVLALAPMSVVPSQSHRGIGAELVNAAVQRARDLGFPAIVVAGQPEYYLRWGFAPGNKWQIQTTPPVGSELLTVMELVPNTLPMAGRVIYPALFAAIF